MVGGGPAGAVTALALAGAGCSTVLLEQTVTAGHRYGETLPPEIRPLLADLGLLEDFSKLGPVLSPGTVVVWGSDRPSEQDFVFKPEGQGWHVDRAAFDAMLRSAAAGAGARIIQGVRVGRLEQAGVGWCLYEDADPPRRWQAAFVLDASGRPGLRIEGRPARIVDDSLVAVVLRVGAEAGIRRDLRTTIEAVAGGWWYSAPIPGDQTVAMFFTDSQTLQAQGDPRSHLSGAPLVAARLEGHPTIDERVLSVQSSVRSRLSGRAWLAVGDAAASFDPVSGMGVLSAMSQGLYAAQAACRYIDGDASGVEDAARSGRHVFARYRSERLRYYASEGRFGTAGFWGRRLRRTASNPAVLPDKPR